jgi:DNA-binding IclR family transcriptional regulator
VDWTEVDANTLDWDIAQTAEGYRARLVRSLRRGLRALGHVVDADTPPRLSGIAVHLDLDKASPLRVLAILVAEGLVARDPIAKTYRVGSRMMSWIFSRRHEQHFLHLARPGLETLASRTRERPHLGLLTGDMVTLVDTVAADSPIAIRHCAGIETDLHSTSVGQVLLADASEPMRGQLLATIRLERHTAKTIVDPRRLEAELLAVREQGYALDDAEFNDWIFCVAALVLDAAGGAPCAIGVSTFRPTIIDDPNRRATVIAKVRDCARALSG